MPSIVQFTHPGNEHVPDKKNGDFKSWNKENHKRKFLLCNGDYVDGNSKKTGDIMFWGEWEPDSYVSKLKKENHDDPQWLHKPILKSEIPESDGFQMSYQNSDPFVFGKEFRYFVCKQIKKNKTTKMAKIEPGSLILFGSTKGQTKDNAYFMVDTVFVVSSFIEYNPDQPDALSDIDETYKNIVYKMAFPKQPSPQIKGQLRLYIGATYDNPFKGMYSFSPAKLYNNDISGFPRIKLKDLEYITNNLNSAVKISDTSIDNIKTFWEKIRELSRKEGCVEGISFKYQIEK